MPKQQLNYLPRCPHCEGRLSIGKLLTFDTKQVMSCQHCHTRLQIDMQMTVVDWMILIVSHVIIAVYSLYLFVGLMQAINMLYVSLMVIWFLLLLIAGQCAWRIYFPRITLWEPTCLGCGYSLKGLSRNECPECGKGFDLADYETLNPGLRVFVRILAVTTLLVFVFETGLGVLINWLSNGAFHVRGYPIVFYGLKTLPMQGYEVGFIWNALVDDLFLSLLVGFFISLYVMHLKIRRRHRSQLS